MESFATHPILRPEKGEVCEGRCGEGAVFSEGLRRFFFSVVGKVMGEKTPPAKMEVFFFGNLRFSPL